MVDQKQLGPCRRQRGDLAKAEIRAGRKMRHDGADDLKIGRLVNGPPLAGQVNVIGKIYLAI